MRTEKDNIKEFTIQKIQEKQNAFQSKMLYG